MEMILNVIFNVIFYGVFPVIVLSEVLLLIWMISGKENLPLDMWVCLRRETYGEQCKRFKDLFEETTMANFMFHTSNDRSLMSLSFPWFQTKKKLRFGKSGVAIPKGAVLASNGAFFWKGLMVAHFPGSLPGMVSLNSEVYDAFRGKDYLRFIVSLEYISSNWYIVVKRVEKVDNSS